MDKINLKIRNDNIGRDYHVYNKNMGYLLDKYKLSRRTISRAIAKYKHIMQEPDIILGEEKVQDSVEEFTSFSTFVEEVRKARSGKQTIKEYTKICKKYFFDSTQLFVLINLIDSIYFDSANRIKAINQFYEYVKNKKDSPITEHTLDFSKVQEEKEEEELPDLSDIENRIVDAIVELAAYIVNSEGILVEVYKPVGLNMQGVFDNYNLEYYTIEMDKRINPVYSLKEEK